MELDQQTQDRIKSLLAKPADQLTDEEASFLQARRSYIGKRSTQRLATVLDKEIAPAEAPEDPNYISYKDLQGKARALGIPYKGIDKEELLRAVDTAGGAGVAPIPD